MKKDSTTSAMAKSRRTKVLLAVGIALVAAAIASARYFTSQGDNFVLESTPILPPEVAVPLAEERQRQEREAQRQTWVDSGVFSKGISWEASESVWLETRKDTARKFLEESGADILVVPLQMAGRPFDSIERSMISRVIAESIAAHSDRTVADPSLVFRFFGGHKLSYEDSEVTALADALNVSIVVLLTAEFEATGEFDLSVSVRHDSAVTDDSVDVWGGLEFSKQELPYMAVQKNSDDIASFILGHDVAARRKLKSDDVESLRLPETVEELSQVAAKSPLHSAALLQWFGTMHIGWTDNTARNQLFERSLVELSQLEDSPQVRHLTARALMNLDRRPAAVAQLKESDDRYERRISATLNGNLSPLLSESGYWGTSLLDYLAWRDLLEIESAFGELKSRDTADKFAKTYPLWEAYLSRTLDPRQADVHFPPIDILAAVSEQLAQHESVAREHIEVAMAAESGPMVGLTGLVNQHIENNRVSVLSGLTAGWPGSNAVSAMDMLELAEATTLQNFKRSIEFDLHTRVIPEKVVAAVNSVDDVYAGHPELALIKANALSQMMDEMSNADRHRMKQQIAATRLDALAWTGQLTPYALFVLQRFERTFRETPQSEGLPRSNEGERIPLPNRYHVWPKTRAWYQRVGRGVVPFYGGEDCLDYVATAFDCLFSVVRNPRNRPESERDLSEAEYLEKFAGRFLGHQHLDLLQQSAALDAASHDEAKVIIARMLERGETSLPLFETLGRLHFRDGDYAQAHKVWLSYPAFRKNSAANKIGTSNQAAIFGANLFWVGQHELARSFFEISSSLSTYSGSEFSAHKRLALIDRKYDEAMAWAVRDIERYDGVYSKRDLMQFLHMLGESEQAWSFFDEFLNEETRVEYWQGALAGHQVNGSSTIDVRDWLLSSSQNRQQKVAANSRKSKDPRAARYLLQFAVMDRRPDADLESLIRSVEVEPRPIVGFGTLSNQPDVDNRAAPLRIERSIYTVHRPEIHLVDPEDTWMPEHRDEVESHYELAARALTALRNEQYEASFDAFARLSRGSHPKDLVSYYVFSAAKIGKTGHIEEWLQHREREIQKVEERTQLIDSTIRGKRFDEDLAYAVLDGLAGRHSDAIKRLKAALNDRQFKDDRILYPLYQIVDLADMLYEETQSRAYKEFVLDLSRRHTVIAPMFGWAYFKVAKYSEDREERIAAAASGLALDPNSHTGAQLPEELIQAAVAKLEKEGPPYLQARQTQ